MYSLRISFHLITVLFILFVYVCAYMNRVHMCVLGTCGTEKIGSPELEVHVATGSLMWVLGTQVRSSARASSALTLCTVSPGHTLLFLRQALSLDPERHTSAEPVNHQDCLAPGAEWLQAGTALPGFHVGAGDLNSGPCA